MKQLIRDFSIAWIAGILSIAAYAAIVGESRPILLGSNTRSRR
jgi:hypothetical protein